jgi:hypothetical protein
MNKKKIKAMVDMYRGKAKTKEGYWIVNKDKTEYILVVFGHQMARIRLDVEGFIATLPGFIVVQHHKSLKAAMNDCRHAVSAWLFVCNECANRKAEMDGKK